MEPVQSIIAADIGGTNSRFAQFTKGRDGTVTMTARHLMATAAAHSFGELLYNLAASPFPAQLAAADIVVFAVAGPVEAGRFCQPPNIAWSIDLSADDQSVPPGRTVLINDFVAQAWACRSPVAKTARMVLPGEPVAGGVIGVIGAGTGLGKAVLVDSGDGRFTVLPSEGGHCLFPFVSEREFAFQQFCREQTGRRLITGDQVVSGTGLILIHRFLTGEELAPQAISARFAELPETLAWMARFYGRVCRDHVLASLALGGLFIGGGIAAQAPEIVCHDEFRREFHDDPDFGRLLRKVPVRLLDNRDAGLWGAALYGCSVLAREAGDGS